MDYRYLFAMDYLVRHELSLSLPREELTAYEEEVILFVSGGRHLARKEVDDYGEQTDANLAFREEAEPGEMSVTDRKLREIARGRH